MALSVACAACNVEGPLILERPRLETTGIQTSWLGNSFGGADQQWMPRRISGLSALGDGTLFVMSENLAHRELSATRIVKHGAQIGQLQGQSDFVWAGSSVTGTTDTIFAAVAVRHDPDASVDQPAEGLLWNAIRRHDLDGSTAAFDGGRGADNSLFILNEEAVGDSGDTPGRILALAVNSQELFVATAATVSVFDASDMRRLRSFTIPEIMTLALAPNGTLWTIDGTPAAVHHFTALGEPLPDKITDLEAPRALTLNPSGQLLVADDGPSKQVHVYSTLDGPRLLTSYGAPGGLGESGGTVSKDRWLGLSALASDDLGNVYLGMNSGSNCGARLVALTQGGAPQWELASVAAHESASFDVSGDGLDVVTSRARFRMDYQRAAGEQASWHAWSLDWQRFPNDPRLSTDSGNTIALRVLGARLIYNTASAPMVSVFREEAGTDILVPAIVIGQGPGPARPTGGEAAKSRAWLWRDDDGDGQFAAAEYSALDLERSWSAWVDDRGTIWRASETSGIDAFPLDGIDAQGVPSYSVASTSHRDLPAPFLRLQGIQVVSSGDSAYLAGYTSDLPNPYGAEAWTSLGTAIIRYDSWGANPKLRWRIATLLDDRIGHRPWAFAVAGERLFLTYVNDESLYVFDTNDGSPLGKFEAGPEVNAWLGTSRTWMSLTAFQRLSGEYLLFAADQPHSKVTYFRIPSSWPN